jgi:hypothetical protein
MVAYGEPVTYAQTRFGVIRDNGQCDAAALARFWPRRRALYSLAEFSNVFHSTSASRSRWARSYQSPGAEYSSRWQQD